MRKVLAVIVLCLGVSLPWACNKSATPTSTGNPVVNTNPQVTQPFSGLNEPYDIAADSSGNFYVAERALGTIIKINQSGTISTVASGFSSPTGVVLDSHGNIFVAEEFSPYDVYKITGGTKSVFATGFSGPHSLAIDGSGNLYVADNYGYRIYKITSAGVKTPFAGSGSYGLGNGPALSASFRYPHGIAVNNAGTTVYVGDSNNSVIRQIAGGVVSTLATGFSYPENLGLDGQGNVYVSDVGNATIYKVTPGGSVSTFVGSGLTEPRGMVFVGNSVLYVADGAYNSTNVPTIHKILLPVWP